VSTVHTRAALPRGLLIAQAWSELGDAVAPLSNSAGRPLARTVKLILDPLVLRPVLNPSFAAGAIDIEHVDALRERITQSGPVLAATAAWFLVLKRVRRSVGITEGNPQDLYFQRCYELASEHGHPQPDAGRRAAVVLAEIHGQAGPTMTQLRQFVTEPRSIRELALLMKIAWAGSVQVPPPESVPPGDFLATCATRPDPVLFEALIADLAGTRAAVELARPGAAQGFGLTDRDLPAPPEVGVTASKKTMPRPFDRSIVERLFGPLTSSVHRDGLVGVDKLVYKEISRSSRPWQLAGEPARVVMVLGREVSAPLIGGPADGAAARLRLRWEREAYVHRVLRMPAAVPDRVRADVHQVREAYMRRLWVRVHGREVRQKTVAVEELWDMLDGVLRSVILDQRDRLRSELERQALGASL
jgi:hypothetical protein